MFETYRGVVYPWQLDHMGHMNVQWYASKFDEATWHLVSKLGISANYMRENERGMVAVAQPIEYKSEALAGDLLVIKSRVLEIREKVLRFMHAMYNAETGLELATTELTGVHIDRDKRKSCPFPADIFQRGVDLMKKW